MTEEQVSTLGRIVAFLAHEAFSAALYSPHSSGLYEFMKDPKPGHHVIESSSFGSFRRGPKDWRQAIGRLILKREEFFPFAEDEGGYMDTVWYIEAIDGRLVQWRNCDFRRLPTDFIGSAMGGSRSVFHTPPEEDAAWASEAMARFKIPSDPLFRKTKE